MSVTFSGQKPYLDPRFALASEFTGHTGNSNIHFTQAQISITESQISDLGDYALDSKVDSLSGYAQSHISNTSNPHNVTIGQIGAAASSHTHSASDITAGTLDANRLDKNPGAYILDPLISANDGFIHKTLVSPTVAQAAISKSYVGNKSQFQVPDYIQYSVDNQANWLDLTGLTTVTETDKKTLVMGRYTDGNAGLEIPYSGCTDFKLGWDYTGNWNEGYVYLNYFYSYYSTNGNSFSGVRISAKDYTTQIWEDITTVTESISSWPGHLWVPHSYIPFVNSAGRYDAIEVVFSGFNWSNVYSNSVKVYNVNWYGTYPANPQNEIYSWNEDGVIDFNEIPTADGNTVYTSANISSLHHGGLSGLSDDDHTQYVPTNASRGFTAVVSGKDPTQDYHLSTKAYVDSQVIAASSGVSEALFASHTGDSTIHFTQAEISITESQISDLQDYALQSDFTGHTGNGSIHFTQSEISITESQISDLRDYALQTSLDSLSGEYTGHTHFPSGINFSTTDILLGRSGAGAGAGEEIPCTSVGRALLAASTTSSQRTALAISSEFLSLDASNSPITDNLSILSTKVGGTLTFTVKNGATSGASYALFTIETAGSSTGDPYFRFANASRYFSVGLDTSTDEFKIGTGATLSTSNLLRLTSAGLVYLVGALNMGSNKINNVADGTLSTDVATVGQLNSVSGNITGHTGDSSIHYTQGSIAINASQVTAGTFLDARIAESNVTQHEAALSITESQISDLGDYALDGKVDILSGYTQSHISNTSNPHSVTAAQVGAPTVAQFTGHTGQSNIHFTESSINHNNILNAGINSHSAIDAHLTSNFNPHSVTASQVGAPTLANFTGHTGNGSIHFQQTDIDHVNLQNKGAYTHTQIDDHIESISNPHGVTASQVGAPTTASFTSHTGDASIHYTVASIDHGSIAGLGDDDHTQYIRVDATRGFTNPISGQTPTQTYHLVRKDYVDTADTNLNAGIAGNFALIAALTDILTGHTGNPEAHAPFYKTLDFDDFYEFTSSRWSRDVQANGSSFTQNITTISWLTGKAMYGIYRLTTNGSATSSADRVLMYSQDTTSWPSIYSQSGYHYIWRASLDAGASQRCYAGIGVVTSSTTGMPSPAICFEFDSSNSNIKIKANNGTTEQVIDSGITLGTYNQNPGTFELVSNGTSIDIYIDGAYIDTFTSGLPSVANSYMYPIAQNIYNGSTFRSIYLDRFELGTSNSSYMITSKS